MWSLAGADNLIPAIGDHDIGDNDWIVGTPRALNVNTMKMAFGTYMVDPQGLPATWNGVSTRAPEGSGQYDEATYLRQVQNVLFVSLDVFQYQNGAAVDGNNAVGINVTATTLTWLSQVLDAADNDPSVDHVIVQGHTPILWPVSRLRSSSLHLQGGQSSDLWQLLADHGTNVGGKVRAYLAGEVHATTTTPDPASGIVQIAHGNNWQAEHSNASVATRSFLRRVPGIGRRDRRNRVYDRQRSPRETEPFSRSMIRPPIASTRWAQVRSRSARSG